MVYDRYYISCSGLKGEAYIVWKTDYLELGALSFVAGLNMMNSLQVFAVSTHYENDLSYSSSNPHYEVLHLVILCHITIWKNGARVGHENWKLSSEPSSEREGVDSNT